MAGTRKWSAMSRRCKSSLAGKSRITSTCGLLTIHSWFGPVKSSHWTSGDRKSTRLNSSHTVISYAVFCLKKKKNLAILQTHPGDLHRRYVPRNTHHNIPCIAAAQCLTCAAQLLVKCTHSLGQNHSCHSHP